MTPPIQTELLVKGATFLVRAADRVERDCGLPIEGNRIARVVPTHVGHCEPEPGWRFIDAAGCAVIPGLINDHTHMYQNFLKGLNDGLSLVDWCTDVLFPAADVIHADHRQANDQRRGYNWWLAAALEMIKSGTTCCINMDLIMDAVFQAWLDIGFRGVGAVTVCRAGTRRPVDPARDPAVDRDTAGADPRLCQTMAPDSSRRGAHPGGAGALDAIRS
jgi:5-methylthioadenosine/S-adenosylhomocysteine deaminase